MKKNVKSIIGICFLIYIIFLLYLTILSRIETLHFIWENGRFDFYIKNRFNIVPLKSIIYIFYHLSFKQAFLNIIGNILAFMPFAFFLPYFAKRNMKFVRFLELMVLISLSVELIQMITLSGSFDVDDIILNVLGALIAYFILNTFYIKYKYFDIKKENINIQKVFFICFVIIGSIICFMIYSKKETYLPNTVYFINRSKNCKQEEEQFYENEYFEYYLSCPNKYYISLNHNEYRIKEALDKKIIGIEQLETFHFNYTKKSKYQSISIKAKERELVQKEIENEEIIEIKEMNDYQIDKKQVLHHFYIRPIVSGKTILTLKIINSNTGEVEGEMKYEIVVSEKLETVIHLITG